MKIAILTTDNREHHKDYSKASPYFGAAPEALLQGFADLPGIEVHVISCARQRMISPEKIASNIWFHSLIVPKFGWMTSGYQGCIRATRRRLRDINPDIVHGQGTERECAMGAAFSGYPNVITIHGNMAELARLAKARIGSFGWLAARLENVCLRRTVGVFCNSAYTENLVKPRSRKTWRVPNALRSAFFAGKGDTAQTDAPGEGTGPTIGIGPNGGAVGRVPPRGVPGLLHVKAASSISTKTILVNVGVISPRKRQVELLDVIDDLGKTRSNFEFWFVGDCADNEYARSFQEKLKPLTERGTARHLGTKSTSELIGIFDEASALVHFPFEEAFGLVVAEALARDLKLFAARTGGIIDISEGVPEAELFDVRDFGGLKAGMDTWMQVGSPRPSSEGVIMRARYHPQVVAKRHVEIYKEVLRLLTSAATK